MAIWLPISQEKTGHQVKQVTPTNDTDGDYPQTSPQCTQTDKEATRKDKDGVDGVSIQPPEKPKLN
eukprot:12680400-Ditylum_brightwellii.AAC.1